MSTVPTMNLRFEQRWRPAVQETLGGGTFVVPYHVLQQMHWDGNKQVWIDVPIVEEQKEPTNA